MNQTEANEKAIDARRQIDAINERIKDLKDQIRLEKKSLEYWGAQLAVAVKEIEAAK